MAHLWKRTVCFVNASVSTERGEARSLRFGSTILDIDQPPRRGDRVIDLDGAFVLPGLVNGHDHLELNHYGRLKFRESYSNVSEWIEDMRPRLHGDPGIRAGQLHSLSHRLFIGGLKNLLAGVTTVAHHNPFYRELRRGFPIRVVRRYGWAHSFALERGRAGARGEVGGEVAARHRSTPRGAPFFVHLAEGIDAPARGELRRLESLGCLGPDVVVVHGVSIDPAEWPRLAERGAGLVWCPGSNVFLFKRTAPVRAFLDARGRAPGAKIALGTDSRLSGGRDLLDELRTAAHVGRVSATELLEMVTTAGASLLRQPAAGRLFAGGPADLLVVPRLGADPARALLATARRDVTLVVVAGQPLIGDRIMAGVFDARGIATAPVGVDGARKIAAATLVRRIAASPIVESGVEAL
jgi:cytosine/adenosine deaminase-related metal-dependent hydrolase